MAPVTRRALRIVLLGLAVAAALGAAGCGTKGEPALEAETEGPYVDFGEVKYQVQMSRELNPADVEDGFYLRGLPEGTEDIPPDKVFFGVWMRAQNTGDEPAEAAREFEITDSQETVYRPIPLDPRENAFVYEGGTIGPNNLIPEANTPASEGPIQGSLLLFRLDIDSYENRPLQLHFRSPTDPELEGSIDLDL